MDEEDKKKKNHWTIGIASFEAWEEFDFAQERVVYLYRMFLGNV